MDLLFKRYASPFLILDQMILTDCLGEFISRLNAISEEEKLWNLWLHKVFDGQPYSAWKESLAPHAVPEVSKSDIEATIKRSYQMLQSFNPEKEGGLGVWSFSD